MLKITIINPDEVVYEGEAEYVLAPTKQGVLGILEGHTPIFAELIQGELVLHAAQEKKIPIEAGIIKVRADLVTILIGL